MTNSTINITGADEVVGFFGKGNRLWFGPHIDPNNTVVFEGDTDEDFFNAAREAISRMSITIGENIGFEAVPILNELDLAGGEEGDVALFSTTRRMTTLLGSCK